MRRGGARRPYVPWHTLDDDERNVGCAIVHRNAVRLSTLDRINLRIVRQHAEESAHLWSVRDRLLRAAHITLRDLRAHDDRISAHLDGIAAAGEAGWRLCQELLENPGAGETFSATVRALDDHHPKRVMQMLAVSVTASDLWRGTASAFGWVPGDRLQGIVKALVASDDSAGRLIGIAACGMHRVDPGLISRNQFADSVPAVRARAFRTAGDIGCAVLGPALIAAETDQSADCRFWASWAAVLLGNRGAALKSLAASGLAEGPHRPRAFRLALQALSLRAAREFLRGLTTNSDQQRWVIYGAGVAGDAAFPGWLIDYMDDPKTARVAGEAFTLITGADLTLAGLEREHPESFDPAPSDDPDDPNVEMDPDEDLPWPDRKKVQVWWDANASRYQPATRYFLGAPITREHCIDVLKNGYQRQRILAAHYLCLLEPGTPLFNTSAPAWRQQRLLAQMS